MTDRVPSSDKPCPGNCPVPHISLHVSADGGRTWAPQRPLCACKGSWQYDPVVEVVPNTGALYAAYLNGFNVTFTMSTDRGQTWTAPVKTYGNVSWNDKPALATSDDGRDVYLSWNGPTGGDPYVAQSHDFGQTWTQLKLVDSNLYYFAFDADVLHDGTVVFAESEIDYSGPGGAPANQVRHHVFVSRDAGATWEDHVVDTVNVGELPRRRVRAGLLHRPRRALGRRRGQPGAAVRRGNDRSRPAADLRAAVDGRRPDLEPPRDALGRRRERNLARRGVPRQRRRSRLVHADDQRR